MLDEEHRKLRADFLGDVFGFYDLPMMTQDRKRQVFQVHNIEQFVFLIADDPPMTCARLDHFGLSVGAEAELDEILARARAWQERDDRVDIIDKKVDDHGMLAITSIYVRYLLPMMIEIQWWDFKGMPRRRPRSEVTAPELRYGAFAPQGWKLEYTGWDAAERVGAHEGARAAHRAARLPPPLGVRPRRDGAAPRAHAHVRGVHDARRARAAHRARSSSARWSRARRTATPVCSPRKPRASTCSPAAG